MTDNINIEEFIRDARALASHADDIFEKAIVHQDSILEIDIACLFIRIVRGAKAILLLCDNNYAVEAGLIGRSCLEALFYMGACIRSPKAMKLFGGRLIIGRLKAINLVENDPEYRDEEARKTILKDKDYVLTEIRENGLRELKVEEAAQIAGLSALYISYRLHSYAVHLDPAHLHDTYLDYDYDSDTFNQINVGKVPESLDWTIATLNMVLAKACRLYRELFHIPCSDAIQKMETAYLVGD